MKRINVNLYPKDGYIFIDKDGTKLIADSWKALMARVADYRKRNGIEPGNPESEVHDQACERNPSYCSEQTEQQRQMTQVASLKGRVLGWLSGLVRRREKTPLAYVDANVAAERQKICVACPKNMAVAEGCSSCRAALKAYREDLLGSRKVSGRIAECVILGEDLPVSIHLDEVRVLNNELPANCWRKAER